MPAHGEPSPGAAKPVRAAGELRWLRTDIVLLAVAIGLLVWLTGPVLLMVFAGILLAVALDALAAPIVQRTRVARSWALVGVVLALIVLLGGAAMLIVPQFLEQLGQIVEQLSDLVGQAQLVVERYPWMEDMLGIDEEEGIGLREVAGQVAVVTVTAVGAIASLLIMIVIGLFIAANPALYRGGFVTLVPMTYRARAQEILSTMGYALRWWLLGQLVSMFVLGVTTSLGLLVIGVELWLGLGVLVGLLTFIPFLGPIIAGVPVVLIGFAHGLETGLIVLAFYLVLQNLEGNLLTPMIQQRAIRMPPALLITMQVLLGTLFGLTGLVLAAPLAVAGMVAVNLLYVEDVLGDRRTTP
jgi:predicted PurR-regulated permease PerM